MIRHRQPATGHTSFHLLPNLRWRFSITPTQTDGLPKPSPKKPNSSSKGWVNSFFILKNSIARHSANLSIRRSPTNNSDHPMPKWPSQTPRSASSAPPRNLLPPNVGSPDSRAPFAHSENPSQAEPISALNPRSSGFNRTVISSPPNNILPSPRSPEPE